MNQNLINPTNRGQAITALIVLGAIVLLILFGLPLIETPIPSVSEVSEDVPQIYDDQAGGSQSNKTKAVTIDDIMEDPDIYKGLTVTVEGKVVDWVARNAFTIKNPDLVGQNLLVISSEPFKLPKDTQGSGLALSEEGVKVKVTGQVEIYNNRNPEQLFGENYEGEELSDWDGEPVIMSESIEVK